MGGRNARQKARDKQMPLKRYSAEERKALREWEQSILSNSSNGESNVESPEKSNISRSSIFRNKMKVEVSKYSKKEVSGKSKISEHFKVAKPEENIGKEPGE